MILLILWKNTDLDDKLKILNKKLFQTKKKHVLAENEINELSKNVEATSAKGLTKDLINGYKIINGEKYFSSGIFQTYRVSIPTQKYIKYFNFTLI